MDIGKQAQEIAKTAKLEDHSGTFRLGVKDSRLQITVGYQATGSVDLPGELDAVVAQIGSTLAGLLGMGNSSAPSTSSGG